MYDILVVDDDLFALALLEEQLKGYGDFFSPVYASNGKEAVEILGQVEISLLVTDLIMPGDINGWHLIEYIENFHPNIPIVVITGCKNEDKVAHLKGRVREILLKPIRVKQLVNIVTNILNEDIATGSLKGVSVGSFLQLLEMDEKTCLLEVGTSPKNKGSLYIHQGQLYDAEYGDLKEYEAACRLIALDNVNFQIKALPKPEIRRRIKTELMSIIMDAMKMKDEVKQDASEVIRSVQKEQTGGTPVLDRPHVIEEERDRESQQVEAPDVLPVSSSKEKNMTTLETLLEGLRGIKGYKASGIMNFTGEMLASDCIDSNHDLENIGAVFNDIFRSAHEAAEKVELTACSELTMKTPEGIVIITCSSGTESTVPLHLIALLDKEGNQALTKIQLKKIIPLAGQELN
ncbi:MAG: response regulator [Candidatus Electrothrix sp. AR4]|nr:response regulator [Candidatus Electrothrix sp. AR4]